MTNKELVNFVKSKLNLNTAYMWGDFGRIITSTTIAGVSAQYPLRYTDSRKKLLKSYVGKNYYGCDCTGLYKWFLWTDNDTHGIRYTKTTDRGTEMMFSAATERGKISALPEIPGLILYKIGHVGVYIGNGECVECTLGTYGDGIVKTKVKGRGWTHWLKMPEITYETEKAPESAKPVSSTTAKFPVGTAVVISGNLYASSNATAASGKVLNKKTKITRYAVGAKHPYNTTGDLGWMDESSISLQSASSSTKATTTTSTSKPQTTVTKMKVSPSAGLWLNNSNKRWNSSTHIVLMPKGAIVTVANEAEKKLGSYTCIKVTYNGKTGYCAKEYLTKI